MTFSLPTETEMTDNVRQRRWTATHTYLHTYIHLYIYSYIGVAKPSKLSKCGHLFAGSTITMQLESENNNKQRNGN